MLSWLAMRGVPKEQCTALVRHVARETTARNYEHLSPDYLRAAVERSRGLIFRLADFSEDGWRRREERYSA